MNAIIYYFMMNEFRLEIKYFLKININVLNYVNDLKPTWSLNVCVHVRLCTVIFVLIKPNFLRMNLDIAQLYFKYMIDTFLPYIGKY